MPSELYYNTGFSFVTYNVGLHYGMAQAKLTWITLRLWRESAINKIKFHDVFNRYVTIHILILYNIF